MITKHAAVAALLITSAVGPASHASEAPDAQIRAENIRAHLEFLADDLLEGREAGTRGYDIAAGYVASEYKQIGLQPAGTNGYFQPVPLRRSVLVPNSVRLTVTAPNGKSVVTFTEADHVAARPSSSEADQTVEAECVFAGFGTFSHGDYFGARFAPAAPKVPMQPALR